MDFKIHSIKIVFIFQILNLNVFTVLSVINVFNPFCMLRYLFVNKLILQVFGIRQVLVVLMELEDFILVVKLMILIKLL